MYVENSLCGINHVKYFACTTFNIYNMAMNNLPNIIRTYVAIFAEYFIANFADAT